MEKQKPSTGQLSLTYGVLLGILSIAFSVILYVTNSLLDQNWITAVIGFLIMLGVIVYGQQSFKKANDGFMDLKDALKVGLGIALIGAIVSAIYNYIFLTVIEPEFIGLIIEKQREAMLESSPNMTEAQQEQAMGFAAKFARPWVQCSIQVIGGIFFGFIISLISGLILKRANPHQY